MPFELIGKKRAKLLEVFVDSLKLGQTELRPALILRLRVTLPNDCLNMLDDSLLPFLYRKNEGSKVQGALEGVPVVSDMPTLTEAGKRLKSVAWKEEYAGTTLTVHKGMYQGAEVSENIVLTDGKRTILKATPKEGGTVDVVFDYWTGDIDGDTIGEIGVLKNHDLDIELTNQVAAALIKQASIQEVDDGPGSPRTPEEALERSLKEDKPTPPAKAAAKEAKGPPRTPLAKKVAHVAKKSRRSTKTH